MVIPPRLRSALLPALLLALAGCEPKETPFTVQLTLQACAGPSPSEGVTHYQFRVTGEGIPQPIVRLAAAGAHRQALPDIPAGKARMLEVRGYQGSPDVGGRVVSLGRSLPFDVPEVVPLAGHEPPAIHVFLRRVNAFTPTSVSVAPETCNKLGLARAGHTATVLRDGRVLIAGGYQLSGNGQPTMISKAELFDPATGAFSDAPELGVSNSDAEFTPSPRAFHTATPLPDGRVLIAGGEVTGTGGATVPLTSALIYDPAGKYYGGLELQVARTRHAAAADKDGRVLLVAGADAQGNAAGPNEWFDPVSARSAESADALGRREVALAPAQGGELLAAAGGTTGSTVSDEVRFYKFSGRGFDPLPSIAHLRQARRSAALAPLGDGSRLVAVGGFIDAAEGQGANAAAASELIDTQGGNFTVTDGPTFSPRADVCLAPLPDGRVLAVGGRVDDPFVGTRSDGSAELLTVPDTGAPTVLGMPSLADPRYQHTCTTLPDGTVLVLGGVKDSGGNPSVLQDAQIFTPAPLD